MYINTEQKGFYPGKIISAPVSPTDADPWFIAKCIEQIGIRGIEIHDGVDYIIENWLLEVIDPLKSGNRVGDHIEWNVWTKCI